MMNEKPNPSSIETQKLPIVTTPPPMPEPASPEVVTTFTFASSARGSRWARLVSGLCRCLPVWLTRRRRGRERVDPLNATEALFTNCEYVSRWGLVEFGVTCPRCDSLAAEPGQFRRIRRTADGEVITCLSCGAALLASPTTEKEEHLLPYTRSLHAFARKRHPLSPYSTQEAAEIRRSKAKPFVLSDDPPECAICKGTGAKRGTKTFPCDMCGGVGIVSDNAWKVQTACLLCQGMGRVIPDKCPACRGRGFTPSDAPPELLTENPLT